MSKFSRFSRSVKWSFLKLTVIKPYHSQHSYDIYGFVQNQNKTKKQWWKIWQNWYIRKKVIQSMLSEPRTAISLMYIAASSLWRSTIIAVEQAWNYIVRPSVTSVTTAEFYRRSHPEQSSCSNEFCRRSFIKYTPWSVCFLIVMLTKKTKQKKTCVFFMSHDLAGVLWTFHFQILFQDLKTSKQKSWLRPTELFQFVNYFRFGNLMFFEL